MQFFYLKANNAVREYLKIMQSSEQGAGGAEIFLNAFIRLTGDNTAQVNSLHTMPENDERLHIGNKTIISYARQSRLLSTTFMAGIIGQFRVSFLIFRNILWLRPEQVLCWSRSFPHWSCFLASKLVGARFIFSRHVRFAGQDEPWFRRIVSCIDKFFIRRAHAVIVHGPYLFQESIASGISPRCLIEFDCTYPPGTVWNQGDASRRAGLSECSQTNKNILFVGRMEVSKGIFELFEACRPLLEANGELRLIFAGEGKDTNSLIEMVARSSCCENVIFLGRVPHNELPEIIKDAYCVVTPTRSSFPEGRCMAAMEGLLMGRPVIAPDFGPFPYLIKDGVNGLLFVPDSVESLRQKIVLVMKDSEFYQRLEKGAVITGEELLSNKTDYYTALKSAFV